MGCRCSWHAHGSQSPNMGCVEETPLCDNGLLATWMHSRTPFKHSGANNTKILGAPEHTKKRSILAATQFKRSLKPHPFRKGFKKPWREKHWRTHQFRALFFYVWWCLIVLLDFICSHLCKNQLHVTFYRIAPNFFGRAMPFVIQITAQCTIRPCFYWVASEVFGATFKVRGRGGGENGAAVWHHRRGTVSYVGVWGILLFLPSKSL